MDPTLVANTVEKVSDAETGSQNASDSVEQISEKPADILPVSPRNAMKVIGPTGCDVWGTQRLDLASVLLTLFREWQRSHDYSLFLDAGTLLGAWRSGKFIPDDDDFDFGIVSNLPSTSSSTKTETELEGLNALKQLKTFLDQRLDAKYATRLVTSYATKLEVFEPAHGRFLLSPFYEGADFHYVTCDIQAFVHNKNQEIYPLYKLNTYIYPSKNVLPMIDCEVELEGVMFPCPCDMEAYLEGMYGYLGTGAVFDKEKGLYVPGPDAPCYERGENGV